MKIAVVLLLLAIFGIGVAHNHGSSGHKAPAHEQSCKGSW